MSSNLFFDKMQYPVFLTLVDNIDDYKPNTFSEDAASVGLHFYIYFKDEVSVDPDSRMVRRTLDSRITCYCVTDEDVYKFKIPSANAIGFLGVLSNFKKEKNAMHIYEFNIPAIAAKEFTPWFDFSAYDRKIAPCYERALSQLKDCLRQNQKKQYDLNQKTLNSASQASEESMCGTWKDSPAEEAKPQNDTCRDSPGL